MKSRFKDKLNNTPHLMTSKTFISVAEYLESPSFMNYVDEDDEDISTEKLLNYNPDTGVGTLFIDGALTYKSEWYQKYFGGTSYEKLTEEFDELVGQGMTTLLMITSSGGGEAYGMMATANYIRTTAENKGIKILCYVDEVSASAAYGISCIADEVIANPEAELGSIGVVVRLMNFNGMIKKAGIEQTYIYAGKKKIPYKADGSFDESFVDDIQYKVDDLYERFTDYVAKNRNMSVEAVRATEAGVYLAKDALQLGLIDGVMTHEEFYTYLADYVQKEKPQMFKNKIFNLHSEQEKVEMKELELATAELSAIKVKMDEEIAVKTALESEVVTLKASLEEAQMKLASFEELSKKLEAEKQEIAQAKAEAILNVRKALLSEVIPSDKLEDTTKALANVSEEVFKIALSGYKAASDTKLNSVLFKELGSDGEVATEAFDPVKAQAEYNKKNFSK